MLRILIVAVGVLAAHDGAASRVLSASPDTVVAKASVIDTVVAKASVIDTVVT